MKVAVINFSGNVGKTTIARQLLGTRMNADEFAVETINAGASDESVRTSRIKGKDFGDQEEVPQAGVDPEDGDKGGGDWRGGGCFGVVQFQRD